MKVAVKEVDEKGRINLSIKAADPTWAEKKGLKGNGGNGASRPKPVTPPTQKPE